MAKDPERSKMLKTVLPLISGDRGKRFAKAVNSGDVDAAKSLWASMGDDLYQAVEMIRDEQLSKRRKADKEPVRALREPKSWPSDDQPEQVVKDYIRNSFHAYRGLVELEFGDRSPLRYKKGFKEAYYFTVHFTFNGSRKYQDFVVAFNNVIKMNKSIKEGITLVGVPEASGSRGNNEFDGSFAYYKN